jgi:hypothetical protein
MYKDKIYTVACRPGAGQQPWDKKIYNSCDWVTALQTNMFPWQQLNHNNKEWCFLRSPCWDVISGTSWKLQLVEWSERIKLFNTLPVYITDLKNDKKQFRLVLRNYLQSNVFYSIDEFVDYAKGSKVKS